MLLSNIKHQRLTTSRGTQVIRFNIEEYLDKLRLEDEFIGENQTHYIIKCPYCEEHNDYHKRKLYIEQNYSRGFCHRCKSSYFNFTNDLEFNLTFKLKDQLKFSLTSITSKDPKYSLDVYNNCYVNKDKIESLLKERRSSKLIPLIDQIGMRGGDNFIIFPFIVKGKLIYWQSKLVGYTIPWFMPPIAHKPCYIPKIVSRKIVIVEGIFDALACLLLFPDRTPVALLGSYLTPYNIWMIREYIAPSDILIFMDNIHVSIDVLFQAKYSFPTVTNIDCYYGKYNQDPDELLDSLSIAELNEFTSNNKYENNDNWKSIISSF